MNDYDDCELWPIMIQTKFIDSLYSQCYNLFRMFLHLFCERKKWKSLGFLH